MYHLYYPHFHFRSLKAALIPEQINQVRPPHQLLATRSPRLQLDWFSIPLYVSEVAVRFRKLNLHPCSSCLQNFGRSRSDNCDHQNSHRIQYPRVSFPLCWNLDTGNYGSSFYPSSRSTYEKMGIMRIDSHRLSRTKLPYYTIVD